MFLTVVSFTEFYLYYVAFAMVVPYMFKVTYDLSKGMHRRVML